MLEGECTAHVQVTFLMLLLQLDIPVQHQLKAGSKKDDLLHPQLC